MAASLGPEHLVHSVLRTNQGYERAGSEPALDPGLLLNLGQGGGEEVVDGEGR